MTTKINRALDNVASFTDAEKQLMTQTGRLITVPERWASMHQGTPADKVYLILDGEVSIRKNKQEVARLGAGELVGETSFSRRTLRNATVIAETSLEVLHFTREEWLALTSRIPALHDAVEERTLVRA